MRTDTRAEGDRPRRPARSSPPAGSALGYDNLVVATGGRPAAPEGARAWTPTACTACTGWPTAPTSARRSPPGRSGPSSSGGGYIGLEMAEVLQTRGLRRHRRPRRPAADGAAGRRHGRAGLRGHVRHGHRRADRASRCARSRWTPTARCAAVRTDAGSYDADLVVLGLGMGPEVALAREAGLRLGDTGAIDVGRTQRSRSHPEVFAAGDCAQTVPPAHRRGDPRRAGHARQQAGPGGRLGDRRPRRRGSPASWGRR